MGRVGMRTLGHAVHAATPQRERTAGNGGVEDDSGRGGPGEVGPADLAQAEGGAHVGGHHRVKVGGGRVRGLLAAVRADVADQHVQPPCIRLGEVNPAVNLPTARTAWRRVSGGLAPASVNRGANLACLAACVRYGMRSIRLVCPDACMPQHALAAAHGSDAVSHMVNPEESSSASASRSEDQVKTCSPRGRRDLDARSVPVRLSRPRDADLQIPICMSGVPGASNSGNSGVKAAGGALPMGEPCLSCRDGVWGRDGSVGSECTGFGWK